MFGEWGAEQFGRNVRIVGWRNRKWGTKWLGPRLWRV